MSVDRSITYPVESSGNRSKCKSVEFGISSMFNVNKSEPFKEPWETTVNCDLPVRLGKFPRREAFIYDFCKAVDGCFRVNFKILIPLSPGDLLSLTDLLKDVVSFTV